MDRSLCYNGQLGLKKSGVKQTYTEEQLHELIRCRDSVSYFLANYVKVISLDDGLVPFKPFEFQEEMLEIMAENRFSIFLLPRQMGKSTIVAGYLLHAAIFNDRYTIALLANKADQSREIMSRIQLMYEQLPWFLQPGVVVWNKGDVELGNGSKIFCAATSGSSIRGRSVNLMYLDEFAHIENDVEFYTSTYPTVTAGNTTKVIITSTPNGMNLFYKLWHDATTGDNAYAYKQVDWHEHPHRDEVWLAEQKRNMTTKQFNQEVLCHFLGSSDTLISGAKLQKLTYETPLREDDNFTIYAEPKKNHAYVATVDVSEGVGQDYSVISIIDVTEKPFTQSLIYRNNLIHPLAFTEVISRVCKEYNTPALIVESNSVGSQTANSMWMDYEYDNMVTTKVDKSENRAWEGARSEKGVRTTAQTKAVGCSRLKALVESDSLLIRDFETIKEMTTFIKKGRSYEADKNKTDDIMMTLVMFAWFTGQNFFEDMTDINTGQMLRDKMKADEEEFDILGFIDDGTSDLEPEVNSLF